MKLIKSIQLFFQEGNSDKVYEIELIESGTDAYVVNFRYGRRGVSLKEGTKTVFPVALAEAEKLFKELESEKRKKGYAGPGENPDFIADITTPKSDTAGKKQHKVIVKLLKAALNDDEHETWPLSRIIWRAGELEIKEAAPLVIKLADKKDPMQLYCCIWALSRTADSSAVAFLQEILKNPYPLYITNLAQAALLNVCDEDTRNTHIALLSETLPYSLKQAMPGEEHHLNLLLKDLFTKFSANGFLVPFYLISIGDEKLRKLFIRHIGFVPIKAGYFKNIRQLFKISEMIYDTELYGILSRNIEKSPYTFNSTHEHINGKWTPVAEELKKENSTLAFSKNTKEYFAKRIMRTLRKAGNDKSARYTKLAADILLPYNDAEDQSAPEKTSVTRYNYDSVARTYTTTESLTWFDDYAAYRSFYFILYGNSTRYRLPSGKGKWQCVPPFVPGAAFQPMREEAFAALWNNAPEDITRLLSYSHSERVCNFALFVFKNNSSFKEKTEQKDLLLFLKSPFVPVQELGFELLKELFPNAFSDTKVLVALLLSRLQDARIFAQQCIDRDPVRFANDAELITTLLFSEMPEAHPWLHAFLLQHKPQQQVLIAVLEDLLQALQTDTIPANETFINSLTKIVESCFKEAVSVLGPGIIFELLLHPNSAIQGFAGKLLVLRNLEPSKVPDTVIFSLLQSDNIAARSAAVDLLAQLKPADLLEKQNLILSLCVSPLQDVRQSAQKLIEKLLLADPSAGNNLVNLFIPVLTVKEKHEGLHHDILQLLSGKLSAYLSHIKTKQVLSLCASRYVASQELGNTLLENNISPDSLSLKELNQLSNSSLLKTRNYIVHYYSTHISRLKEEKKEAIMFADGMWEDVRQFAFELFRTHFQQQDWEPELFVSLCDSIKEDVQAFGREMITKWFEKDKGFDYLLKLSQHPDNRMQLFASGFLDEYATNNFEMLKKLSNFFIMLLSQVNKGHTAKMRSINLLSHEALANEQNALLISAIFNRMSATAAIQDKALYIKAMLGISKTYPAVNVVLQVRETPVYNTKQKHNAV